MLVSLLWRLVHGYVSGALEGVTASDLAFDWWRGTLSLSAFTLRRALIDAILVNSGLHSHLRVRSVEVECADIRIPWARLFVAPIQVAVEGIRVSIDVGTAHVYDGGELDVWKLLGFASDDSAGEDAGMLQRWIAESIEFKMKMVTVQMRFCDRVELQSSQNFVVSIESIEYRNLKLRLMEKGVVLPPCEDCSRLYTEAKNDIMPGFEILIKDFAITVEDEDILVQEDDNELASEERRSHLLLGPTFLRLHWSPSLGVCKINGHISAPLIIRIRNRDLRMAVELSQKLQALTPSACPIRPSDNIDTFDMSCDEQRKSSVLLPLLDQDTVGAHFEEFTNLEEFELSLDRKFLEWSQKSCDVLLTPLEKCFSFSVQMPSVSIVLLQQIAAGLSYASTVQLMTKHLEISGTLSRSLYCIHLGLERCQIQEQDAVSTFLDLSPKVALDVHYHLTEHRLLLSVLFPKFCCIIEHQPVEVLFDFMQPCFSTCSEEHDLQCTVQVMIEEAEVQMVANNRSKHQTSPTVQFFLVTSPRRQSWLF